MSFLSHWIVSLHFHRFNIYWSIRFKCRAGASKQSYSKCTFIQSNSMNDWFFHETLKRNEIKFHFSKCRLEFYFCWPHTKIINSWQLTKSDTSKYLVLSRNWNGHTIIYSLHWWKKHMTHTITRTEYNQFLSN